MIVRLKWGQTEYKGTLESIDSYMNVLLRDTEEFIDGENTGSLGLVLILYASLLNVYITVGLMVVGVTIFCGWGRRTVLK